MLVGMAEDAVMAAASSGCSSGCQSGWTTYLDDDRSSYSTSATTTRFHGKPQGQFYGYGCECEYSEEDDLSMVSDASSGPPQQCSPGSGATHTNARAERRGIATETAAAARRQSKVAGAVASLLEDTASSPAFFKHSKVRSSAEANGYAGAADSITNAADFSCAFFSATGFESPSNGSALSGCLQAQYSPAPAKRMMPTRHMCRDGSDKIKRW
ncbi:uncharacterized protein LOC100838151 isoform X2 [Brachypodium distachyon]|uniref:Uncharacterized protein n=1 Tax=Brachypodium distachyon TaxID=15368 RepID=A0A0Q3JZY8_BRADI|nr:uncharacterized protein LOC100838151 isoform X2 [Brachypodium distachyon]KQK23091.1 hypothetical protein BRADI_1g71230v3 [Brachypodium distachyon]PNT77969.1 hypothetical protein BRADI_1g71230v3 [Brachypodium distachyon]PNT77970.1 hypothetical protein BRADI_1g71230v3 [Brachypodium distachyon]|eukprot:XP_003561942.1 uncharacterized protein LOC100838151 isoform X2 [Brachypodium distachyon]